MATTTGNAFDTAETQAAVIRLGARYCAYVDTGDFDALVGLFGADAVFRVRDQTIQGSEALEAFFRKAVRGIHLAGLPFVSESADDEVQSVQNFLFVPDGDSTVTRGSYVDRIHRESGGYTFLERTVDMHPSGATASR